MLQCFSLVYSYMLGLGLACCDLGLSHGLAGHCHSEASDVGACLWIWRNKRPMSLKCPQLHASVAECLRCQQTNY